MGTLRFMLGRAGSGKTTQIVREISALLREDPLGDPVLLLAPDQATLLYERLLACSSESRGSVRLTVITFRHLIERLLREGGGSAIPEITPLGRRILIGRLLRRLQPELTFYKSVARQPGLAAKLDEAFAEIERSGQALENLPFIAADIEHQHPQSPLPAKLRDVHRLLTEYERILGTDRLDQHRRFTHALCSAGKSPEVAVTRLYVDDFYDFNSTERALIVQFAQSALQTTVALAVDPARVPALTADEPLDESMLLRGSSLAFRRLHRNASDARVPIMLELLRAAPRFRAAAILHIDKQFEASRPGKLAESAGASFVEAPNRRAEVDAAARQIQRWTRDGYRLRDILVLARDISTYESDVEASFREHGLPCFIDRQRPASHHPLIRTVRALLQLPLTDFRMDVVADLIKPGLAGVSPAHADALENYLLAHRIRGAAAWADAWKFQTRSRDDDETTRRREQIETINATRQRIHACLGPLLTDNSPRPAEDWCQRLCRAMDLLQIPRALAEQIAAREAAGQLEWAASDQAVWTEFSELLDQLCPVLADESLTLREYAEALDVALERFTLAITPPTIDQVLIGSVDRTRSAEVKACVVLGLSEGVFPKRSEEAAALNDEDRRHLDVRQFELRGDSRSALMDEQTLAYLAFTRPSEQLALSRPLADDEGRAIGPSVFWTQLTRLFHEPSVRTVSGNRIKQIATPAQLAAAVIDWSTQDGASNDSTDVEPTSTDAKAQLTKWFLDADDLRVASARRAVERAMRYHNKAALSRTVSLAMFPQPLPISATRLETFAACPFKHFAQYTLGLRERDAADLTRLDLGTVYHQVLENLIDEAICSKLDLAEPIPELSRRVRAFSETAAAELRSEFLLSPGRNQYLLEGVRSTVEHVAETQRHAIAAGAFRPRRTEFSFGFERGGAPLELTTPAGRTIHLRGRIDRIDTWPMGNELAASVTDYKLGEHKADFARVRRGISLQLLTYLLALEAMGESLVGSPVKPAAAFYVQVLRQIQSIGHPDEKPEPDQPSTFLKRYRPRGVVDARYVDALDASRDLSLKTPKERSLKTGDVLSEEAFEAVIRWTRTKIAQLADQIIDGVVSVSPYKIKTVTPCPTCDYRSVCRLDLAFNRYSPITENSNEALEKIVSEAT